MTQRAEALALERHAPVAHIPAEKQRFELVVRRAGQHHAAQQLAALVAAQRRGDRLATQKAVDGRDELFAGLLQPLPRGHPRRGLGRVGRRIDVEAATQTLGDRLALLLDPRGQRLAAGVSRLQHFVGRLDHGPQRERESLGDERGEPSMQLRSPRHSRAPFGLGCRFGHLGDSSPNGASGAAY